MRRLTVLASALVLSAACSAGAPPPASPLRPTRADGSAPVRHVIEVDGDPNGLWWDDAAQKLYVADANGNRVLTWSDADGVSTWRELPAASKAGLGQLLLTRDGSLVATRFGHGTGGEVLVVPLAGEPRAVPGLDPARRRIGLTAAPDGRLFDCWFVKTDAGRSGGVSELALSGKETDVMGGLKKPIGVLVSGDRLFVSDQDLNQIFVAPLADLSTRTVFASLDGPDLLARGPEGTLFAGSNVGKLYRIDAAGAVSVSESGFQQVRGVAYDPAGRRVFVADHDGDAAGGLHHLLHVLPLP